MRSYYFQSNHCLNTFLVLITLAIPCVATFIAWKDHKNNNLVQNPYHVDRVFEQVPKVTALQESKSGIDEPTASLSSNSETTFVEELSEERRSNLLQCLLRDLQIEGVPLLECDADQVHTLQAALWTTMAELMDQTEEQNQQQQRVCMIFENIPMDALRMFVDGFCLLKLQPRLLDHLPELHRLSVSLLGKGVGPALLIEVAGGHQSSSSVNGMTDAQKRSLVVDGMAEFKAVAAMKAFVDRVVVGLEACPHINNFLGGSISYRYTAASDVCNAMSTFWNCICHLAALREDKLTSIVLMLPFLVPSTPSSDDGTVAAAADHDRFAAVAEVISRSLCLYRGDSVYELLHFYPTYDRNLIFPVDQPAHGHLPPQSWLRSMLRHNGDLQAAEELIEEEIALSNYQRRSPIMAVCIKRVSLLDTFTDADSGVVDLELDDGVVVKASAVPTYCRNLLGLVGEGRDRLETALQFEREIMD